MKSYSHLDDLREYYEYRASQCYWIAHARRLISRDRKQKDQSACDYALLLWAESKYQADVLMPEISLNWERLNGQMNGKQGAK